MTRKVSIVGAAATALLLLTMAGSALAGAPGATPAESIPVALADGRVSVQGTLEYVDLEGGFYTVNGWGLIGDQKLFSSLAGQTVIVTGKEFTGVSTRMVKQVEVSMLGYDVAVSRSLPQGVTVAGKPVLFDQQPLVENGVLMVPLRAVVEAAGGSVTWDQASQTVNVTLPDRKAAFMIGESKAELNENGHMYLVRNLLPMQAAPVIRAGRTYVSADALTKILGLIERADFDANLDLTTL
jgi:hypothetical protein